MGRERGKGHFSGQMLHHDCDGCDWCVCVTSSQTKGRVWKTTIYDCLVGNIATTNTMRQKEGIIPFISHPPSLH